MKVLLQLVAIYVSIYRLGTVSAEYIGCFKDTATRAMPVKLSKKTDPIAGCNKETIQRGYQFYGVQNQKECWSGPNASTTYDMYGESQKCVNGMGGPWANSVYRAEVDNDELTGMLNDMISDAESIDDVDVGAFVTSSNKLLSLSNDEWKENPKIADDFLAASEGLLTLGMKSNKTVAESSELMVFSVEHVDTSVETSLVFPDYTASIFSNKRSSNSFVVPTINSSDSANIGGFVYSNLHEKLRTMLNESDSSYKPHLSQRIVSLVLSCKVNPPILFGLNTNKTITITLEHTTPLSADATTICGFWQLAQSNESFGVWSTQGCDVITSNTSHTQCNCTHLTNFAILMQYKDVEVDDDHKRALKILTNIGCSLSLAAIFMTVAIYLAFGLYRATNFHIHMNLCFAIAMAQIFLLCTTQARENEAACIVSSIVLHYFCLCVFTWMLVEGMQIYRKVVSIFSSALKLTWCHLIGWGSPVIIVAISYGARKDHYTDLDTCWLSPDYGIRWAFIAPVLVIIMINIVVTIVTLRKRLQLKSMTTKEMSYKLRTSLRALFVLQPIFGITWLVGICGFTSDAVAAMYIFVILNASQGVLIFIFHCAMNAEVRKAVQQGSHLRIHTRNGTLSSGPKKVPLQKIPSKNSDCSNKTNSRQSSSRSDRELADKEEAQLENLSASPRSTHLVP